MGMSSLQTTLPSSVELLQLLQEQAALQLLMSVRSSVFLASGCMARERSTCFGVFTRPPRVQYRYNRTCAKERTCWRVVTLRTNNFLPSADTSCWVLSSLSTIHASTLAQTTCLPSHSSSSEWLDISLRSRRPATVSNRSCCNVSKARCGVIFSFKQDNRPPGADSSSRGQCPPSSWQENNQILCLSHGLRRKWHMFALEVGCLR